MLLASVTGAGNLKLPQATGAGEPPDVPVAQIDYDWTGTRPARQNGTVLTAYPLPARALFTRALIVGAIVGMSPLAAAMACAAQTRQEQAAATAPRLFRTAATAPGSITIPLDPPPPRRAARTPKVSGARGANRPLVVIDAGHGGHDSGALSSDGRYREKDVALSIARAMRDELVRSGRVRVALTREDDRFLILGDRREIARRLKADLFISVHADSAPSTAARGATVYTLSEVASDRVAAQLAAKENKADVLNGVDLGGENDDVSSILIDLARRETMNVSSAFAALMQREMSPTIPFKGEFHRFAGLIVLKAPDVPSVLLETGYISNEADRELLFSPEYQRNIAIGVRRAVEAHFARQLAAR
jgi:N-acetylmuramoyl-L-alanine amidase